MVPHLKLEMQHITKSFPQVQALAGVDFSLQEGEIHALLGENGAGKTTLMNILSGYFAPDDGQILIDGANVHFRSPRDAASHGISMVHQHFSLVRNLKVYENFLLSLGIREDYAHHNMKEEIVGFAEKFGFSIQPEAYIWQLSAAEQQHTEILKALFRHASILILDEPTSVLTPQQVDPFFETLSNLKKERVSVVFISHKIDEVKRISDSVTVLSRGKNVWEGKATETKEKLISHMFSDYSPLEERSTKRVPISHTQSKNVLRVTRLSALRDNGLPAFEDVSLEITAGEILGVAGVSGNGQKEMVEAISGLRKIAKGNLILNGYDITNASVLTRLKNGLSFIPEDLVTGAVVDMHLHENSVMGYLEVGKFVTRFGQLQVDLILKFAKELVEQFNIKAGSVRNEVKNLSGGNIQKLVVGRELKKDTNFLMAVNPTHGLDAAATARIRSRLREVSEAGCAILLVSEDLDEIRELSNRIGVIYKGRIVDIVPYDTSVETLGHMMTLGSRTGR
jgi:ABC-type uncharacterized transport system ATPase subunit